MTLRNIVLALALVVVATLLLPMAIGAAPADQATIPHDLSGRENCTACHQPGGSGLGAPGGTGSPANHSSYTNEQCATCHQPGAAAPAATTPAAKPTQAAPAAVSTPAPAAPAAAPTPSPTSAQPSTPSLGSLWFAPIIVGVVLLGGAILAGRRATKR